MGDKHAESNYKHHCLKVPRHVQTPQIEQLEDQIGKLNLDHKANDILEVDTQRSDKRTQNSFIEFYDSIPEYEDVNHLSSRDFYKQLECLRAKQRQFYECLLAEDDNAPASWSDRYPASNNRRKCTIKCKTNSESIEKATSRRSVRIESPVSGRHQQDEFRTKLSSAGSQSLATTTSRNKSTRKCSTIDNLSNCTLTTRSAPCSPRKQAKDAQEEEMLIGCKKSSPSSSKTGEMFRANPVPISSKIPLFNKIIYEQEKRREVVKKRSKEVLKARMRLFSFTKREEELADLTRCLSKSSPDLFAKCEKIPRFRAKPVPKNLLSNYAYQRMNEDQYYRSLQKKIRAEEMLNTASLPPSMAKREKHERSKFDTACSKSFREMYELGFLMGASTPGLKPRKGSRHKKKKGKSAISINGTKYASSPSTSMDSVNRSNLAAVLRIQTTRKRMEDDIMKRLDEARVRDEMRWKEKVMRKRPVWQTLAYSQEEDLSMRLQIRRDEEKLRSEEFRTQMQSMYGRVNQQPTLFERQSHHNFAKTRDELIAQLFAAVDSLEVDKEEQDVEEVPSTNSTSQVGECLNNQY